MGIRFRRRIRLAPGLHLNLSGSGVSLSAGPRGASLTVGRNGVFANVGIPGTGIYARERILKPNAMSRTERAAQAPTLDFDPHLIIEPDGSLTLAHPDGTALPESEFVKLRKAHPDFFRASMAEHVESYAAHVAAILDIHLGTPPPDRGPHFPRRDFNEPRPVSPTSPEPGAFDRLIPWRARRLAAARAAKQAEYAEALAGWESARDAHTKAEIARIQTLREGLFKIDSRSLEDLLTEHLEVIDWPRSTSISLEVDAAASEVRLDIDLPEIEEMPAETRTLPKRQWRILVKPLSATEQRRQYARHVHGLVFRVVGEAFARLPPVNRVHVAAYTQRIDPATGHLDDDYIIDLAVERETWSEMNFGQLNEVDPMRALERHALTRDLARNGVLKPIAPPNWLHHEG